MVGRGPRGHGNGHAAVERPNVVLPAPGARHVETLRTLLAYTGSGGNLVNNAHLAAIARDEGATVVTYDNDFERFASVRWERPAVTVG